MSVGSFGCHVGGGGGYYWHLEERREAAKLAVVLGAAPSRKMSQSLMSERLTNPALGSSVAILQTTVLALQKAKEGAWGMSPSLLPASHPTCQWAVTGRGPEIASSCKWTEQ